MFYEFPFSKPAGWSVQKIILLALVTVHGVWIIIHLNLVSRELINPWKLGGYGMYTMPHPSPAFTLYDRRFDGLEITVGVDDRKKISEDNSFFVFRCRPMTVASLQRYLRDNPRLVGIPLRFIISEKKMMRNPIRAEYQPHAILETRWTGRTTFDYAGKVCGKIFRGSAELTP